MTAIENQLFTYRARVVSIYDGDTVRLDIDLGFGIWIKDVKMRLADLNAPEISGLERPQGVASRDWLREQLPWGNLVLIETKKTARGTDTLDKYGRYLVTIWLNGVNLNAQMIDEKFAVPYVVKP